MGFFSKIFNDPTPPGLHMRDGKLIPPASLGAYESQKRRAPNASTSRHSQNPSVRGSNYHNGRSHHAGAFWGTPITPGHMIGDSGEPQGGPGCNITGAGTGSRHHSQRGMQPMQQGGMMSSMQGERAPSMRFNFPDAGPSRSHPGVSRHDFASPHLSHAPPQQFHHPAPRPGKLREGDPLPSGRVDPMATASSNMPLGHRGMREHVPGMTALDVGRHGGADDPRADWKVLRDIEKLQGKKRRD